jgi:HSP20 family protein
MKRGQLPCLGARKVESGFGMANDRLACVAPRNDCTVAKLLDNCTRRFYIESVITITQTKSGEKPMSITRYNPFDFTPFQAFRLIEEALPKLMEPNSSRPWAPAVDILETENELILKADLPEVKQDQIDVRVEDGMLTLRGERKFESEANEKGYHRIERSYGTFSRSFTLPETIDPEQVKANFKDGVLTVTLPKKEISKPRQIKVEVSN